MPDTLSVVQDWLTRTGFADALVARDGRLHGVPSGRSWAPLDLVIVGVHRFEGDADPGDQSVLFALAARDGGPVGTYVAPYGPMVGPEDEAVIRGLEQAPPPPEELRAHTEHDHVVAVLPDRAHAEAAVDELRRLGLGSEHLGVAVHEGSDVAFEHDAEGELAHGAESGVGLGVAAGACAGIVLGAVVVPGLGAVGVGGLLAIGAAGGFGGAMLGGYLGTAAGDRAFREHDELATVPLAPGEVLVAVCSHGRPGEVEAVLERHGGRRRVVHPHVR
jgi:hypothetical protein